MIKNREIRVSLVLIPEATASTLLSVFDIFRLFSHIVPGEKPYCVTIVADTTQPIMTASGIELKANATFDAAPVADIVIMPSLVPPTSEWPTGQHPRMMDWLRAQYAQGAVLGSACTGVFPMLEAGVYDGIPVTCHWDYERALRHSFPGADLRIDKTLIIAGPDNRLVMSGATGSWHDLVLHLISRFSGPAAATAIAKFFLLQWHPEGQAAYVRFTEDLTHNDAAIVKAQAWVRQHWTRANPVDEMMRTSGLPERSFKRRFRNATGLSPMDYVQHTRIEHAKQLLENSALPVDTIAADVGYGDAAFFRKLFKRVTTLTPSAYRMKFRTTYGATSANPAP
ncbi:MAG: helix-turn-helix domain-containing protein [Pseudomonadota bacterium]|nr:helix-turn-helix domain-containing protein [Pseudomonadota bacterium]